MLLAVDLAGISGTAFHDVTGDGLTGDDTRISDATVELYRDDGNGLFDDAADTLLGTTMTNVAGEYRFASTNAGGTLPANTLTAGDYFVQQLPAPGYSPPAATLVTVTSNHVHGATATVIDTYDVTAQAVTASPPAPNSASSTVAASEALGGERDVFVTLSSGDGSVSVTIDQNDSNALKLTSNSRCDRPSLRATP